MKIPSNLKAFCSDCDKLLVWRKSKNKNGVEVEPCECCKPKTEDNA